MDLLCVQLAIVAGCRPLVRQCGSEIMFSSDTTIGCGNIMIFQRNFTSYIFYYSIL